jgi:hypothetical protein
MYNPDRSYCTLYSSGVSPSSAVMWLAFLHCTSMCVSLGLRPCHRGRLSRRSRPSRLRLDMAPSVLWGKYRDSASSWVVVVSFHFLSKSLFTKRLIIRCHAVGATTVLLIKPQISKEIRVNHATSKSGKQIKNSVDLVLKRSIPTERPPLVGEVSHNFCRYRVLRGQRNEFPRPLICIF